MTDCIRPAPLVAALMATSLLMLPALGNVTESSPAPLAVPPIMEGSNDGKIGPDVRFSKPSTLDSGDGGMREPERKEAIEPPPPAANAQAKELATLTRQLAETRDKLHNVEKRLAAQTADPANVSPDGEILPPVDLISKDRAKLDGKQKKAVKLARDWSGRQTLPAPGEDGQVKYTFGATLPTLVCAPLQICVIQLQQGETIQTLEGSDKARWLCAVRASGAGATLAPAISCKPTDAGLHANLVVMTDRRTYSIELLSDTTDWMPLMSFTYPDELDHSLETYRARVDKNREHMAAGQPASAGSLNPTNLDFNFTVEGDSPDWKPVRVYSDGKKTYIQFPEAFGGEVPALVALDGSDGLFSKAAEKLVNYRVIGDRFVVDRVIDQAALIMGVGSDQVRVRISHEKKGA